MIGAHPFPYQPELITADFLSDALDVGVASFESQPLGEERGMLGSLALLEIDYSAGSDGPRRLVAKCAADREGSLASAKRGGTHERELRFYDELADDTPARTPAIHGSWYDPDTAHFLLLQEFVDVDPSVDQIDGLDLANAELLVREMARLHARWWRDDSLAKRRWLPTLDSPQRHVNLSALAGAGWAPLRQLLGELSPAQERMGESLADHIGDMLRSVGALPATLLHSDLRADNLLFSASGDEVVLVDWQGTSVGAPAFDVAYFMSQSLTTDVRRANEDALIALYVSELADAGCSLSRDDALAGYGESMVYGLAVACAIPLISDPGEPRSARLARSMAQRAFAAIDDHGQETQR